MKYFKTKRGFVSQDSVVLIGKVNGVFRLVSKGTKQDRHEAESLRLFSVLDIEEELSEADSFPDVSKAKTAKRGISIS